ncbi:MAG: YdcH family protein [Pseudomonadota bacterium]
MSHVPHELPEMLGMDAHAITTWAESDAHIARQVEEYHTLNRAIHRAETDVEPTSDDHLHAMKRDRLALLDALRAAQATADA